MKAKTGTVVRVTVASKLAEFKDKPVMGKLVDKSATWDSFLKNNGISLDEDQHRISALTGRVIARLEDKVSKVISKYAKKMPAYKVWIVGKSEKKSDPQGREVRQRGQMKNRASSRKKRPTKRLITEVEQPVYLDGSDVENDYLVDENDNDYEDEDQMEEPEVSHCSNNENQDFVFAMPQARPRPRSYSGARGWSDRMETASAISQDTFDGDIGEDIKSVVIARLRDWATNGDLHRLREELHSLQVNRKNLKVARYIPYTMNVLSVLFGGT